jgi:hypothetical protein
MGGVKGAPFEARYEEREINKGLDGVSSAESISGCIYRDSAGRERRECLVRGGGEAHELILISDFEGRTALTLDVAAKAAIKFTGMGPPPGAWPLQSSWSFRGSWSFEDTAEIRSIEGLDCRRAQPLVLPGREAEPRAVGEIWVSDEIKYAVLERVT